ncbi:uncharacterized protein LY79DRAFT_114438 [Colletotrichum navitas]|uniref:Uncharacterized protein n=1 Tax=Colletotrichum navitas TaxID=681940 RepID=A0AAD8Q2Y8_9PEZI|nr:uncharacterized protein LY79DRAFT_114438 [Colletotrichum navitas]KAK1594975.1 hypothetical protein LY79DRAFT_114438 [Colletotrichum navitas]
MRMQRRGSEHAATDVCPPMTSPSPARGLEAITATVGLTAAVLAVDGSGTARGVIVRMRADAPSGSVSWCRNSGGRGEAACSIRIALHTHQPPSNYLIARMGGMRIPDSDSTRAFACNQPTTTHVPGAPSALKPTARSRPPIVAVVDDCEGD